MARTNPAKRTKPKPASIVAGLRVIGVRKPFLFKPRRSASGRVLTVGRSTTCDIPIDDMTVSRVHCTIERVSPGQYTVKDCGSTAGVWVSPVAGYTEFHEVDAYTLHLGMHIRLGDITVVPVNQDGGAPINAITYSEFAIKGKQVYDSYRAASRYLRRTRSAFREFVMKVEKDRRSEAE